MQRKIGHIFATLLFFISFKLMAQEEIVLTGVFKGDPVFILNPYHPGLKNFCINSIVVYCISFVSAEDILELLFFTISLS